MIKRTRLLVKKLIILAVGVPITIVGIILIPLPGPGVLIALLGLFVLSLEFEFADNWFGSIKQKIQDVYDESMKRYHERLDEIDKR